MTAAEYRDPRVTDVSGPDPKFGHIGFQVDGDEYPMHATFVDTGNGLLRYSGAIVALDRQTAERLGVALIEWSRHYAMDVAAAAEPAPPQDVALFDVEDGAP